MSGNDGPDPSEESGSPGTGVSGDSSEESATRTHRRESSQVVDEDTARHDSNTEESKSSPPGTGEPTSSTGEDSQAAASGSDPSGSLSPEGTPTDELRRELEDVSPSDLTIPPQSLNPRVRIVWIIQSLISATFFGIIAAVIDLATLQFGLWVGPAVFGLFGLIGVVHAILRYRVWEYEVREDALYLERGVVTRVRTVVPYVRIQHVDASRGPVERLVGLASSVVYTAGSRGADVTIPGLTADGADDLQQRLKQMAILAEGDDAV